MFRPVGMESAVDAAIRDAVLPELCRLPGMTDAYAGRLGEDDPERVIASVRSGAAYPPHDPRLEIQLLRAAVPHETPADDGVRLDEVQLDIAGRFDRPDPVGVLRVFRGGVHAGELDAYIAEARRGMLADAAVNAGLHAFYLGRTGEDSFLALSAWSGWDAIELATGGNVRQPFSTRNAARLDAFTIRHFEMLPDLPRPGGGPDADAVEVDPAAGADARRPDRDARVTGALDGEAVGNR